MRGKSTVIRAVGCSSCGHPALMGQANSHLTCPGCQAYVCQVERWLARRRADFLFGERPGASVHFRALFKYNERGGGEA